MKITLASDLHIECHKNHPPFSGGDVLLLAGDIVVAKCLEYDIQKHKYIKFFEEVASLYKNIYIIMGNHEFYGCNMNEVQEILTKFYSVWPNIKLLNNEMVDFADGVKLWAGTLWTDYGFESSYYMNTARNHMNDHRVIKHKSVTGDDTFMPEDALILHKECVQKLKADLETVDSAVVMTHHVPFYTALNLDRWGHDNPDNYAFACTDMMDLLSEYAKKIIFWVCGHTHDKNDMWFGPTRVMINPQGYRGENPDFKERSISFDKIKNLHDLKVDNWESYKELKE